MIKNLWSILCQTVITDERTKSVSYINVIENVIVNKIPFRFLAVSLGTLWTKTTHEDERLKVRIKFVSPSNDEKILIEADPIVLKLKNHRLNILMDGLLIEKEGLYKFVIENLVGDQWKLANEILLDVTLDPLAKEVKK